MTGILIILMLTGLAIVSAAALKAMSLLVAGICIAPFVGVLALNVADAFDVSAFGIFKALSRYGIDHGYALAALTLICLAALAFIVRFSDWPLVPRYLSFAMIGGVYAFGALRFLFVQ